MRLTGSESGVAGGAVSLVAAGCVAVAGDVGVAAGEFESTGLAGCVTAGAGALALSNAPPWLFGPLFAMTSGIAFAMMGVGVTESLVVRDAVVRDIVVLPTVVKTFIALPLPAAARVA